MLNKDEYNQEEYNNYYRQEIEGAELNGSDDDEGGGIGKLIGVLLLIALAIAGYFGYKMMGSSDDNTVDKSLQVSMDTLPQSVQSESDTKSTSEPTEAEQERPKEKAVQNRVQTETHTVKSEPAKVVQETPKEEKSVENEVSNKVQQAVAASSATKMSPEEIAAIVAAVMKQMNQQSKSSSSQAAPTIEKQDKELMNTLSTTEVDSVSADLEAALEDVDISEDTHIDNTKKQIDVYNKVSVENVKGTDSLSQLSAQITNEIENAEVSSTTTTTNEEDKEYSTDIKKEVVFREKEMRIIIVKKGDTLGKLAKRAYGNVMEYKRIYKANPEITRPDRIYIGQKIRIPLD